MRIRWIVVLAAVVVMVGVAAVAAQNEPRSANDGVEEPAAPSNTLPVEAMVGRSPNEVWGVEATPAEDEREMEGQSPNEAQAPAGALAAGAGRRFLVTTANATGATAKTICPAGYHLASLWELHDVTELVYDASAPGAKTRADMGSGPVAGWWGWVRTGGEHYTANVAGRANCGLWTSQATGQYGTLVMLEDVWTTAGTAISPWRTQTWSCGGQAPSWCVAD